MTLNMQLWIVDWRTRCRYFLAVNSPDAWSSKYQIPATSHWSMLPIRTTVLEKIAISVGKSATTRYKNLGLSAPMSECPGAPPIDLSLEMDGHMSTANVSSGKCSTQETSQSRSWQSRS